MCEYFIFFHWTILRKLFRPKMVPPATFEIQKFYDVTFEIIFVCIKYCKLQPNFRNAVILQSIRRKLFKLHISQ